jgi:hypothetical protein
MYQAAVRVRELLGNPECAAVFDMNPSAARDAWSGARIEVERFGAGIQDRYGDTPQDTILINSSVRQSTTGGLGRRRDQWLSVGSVVERGYYRAPSLWYGFDNGSVDRRAFILLHEFGHLTNAAVDLDFTHGFDRELLHGCFAGIARIHERDPLDD